MTSEFINITNRVKQLSRTQRNRLLRVFFDDPELREDLLDLAALIEAESEQGESVELEEFLKSRQIN